MPPHAPSETKPAERPRLVPERPLPPYSYVPGHAPHPVSHPDGHMFGSSAPPPPAPLDPDNWRACDEYLYGIDLFNHGYYWEAHEAWEALWHAAGRTGTIADYLKGLIKLAAAAVKAREGSPAGAARHARRCRELLNTIASAGDKPTTAYAGLSLSHLEHVSVHIESAATNCPAPSADYNTVLQPT